MSSSKALNTTNFNHLRTTLYVALLELISLNSSSQEAREISSDLTLGRLLIQHDTQHRAHFQALAKPPIFTRDELLSMGLPQQRHLSSSLQRQLLNEVQRILSDIESFLRAGKSHPLYYRCYTHDCRSEVDESRVPDNSALSSALKENREGLDSLKHEIEIKTESIKSLLPDVDKLRQNLDALIRGLLETVPLSLACHSAQGELWSATVENALIKLSLLKAQSERQLYNHTIQNKEPADDVSSVTVSQALEVAYKCMQDQEQDMLTEARSLDGQLQEYSTLLELVDGGKKGAFKQVVDDWTKIKQDTDECLKDLRRLGWTGE